MQSTVDEFNSKVNSLTNTIEKRTLSVKELQQSIGLSYQKTMELVHKDDFPKIVVGRRILIIKSKLDEWLESNIGLAIQ